MTNAYSFFSDDVTMIAASFGNSKQNMTKDTEILKISQNTRKKI